MPRGFEQNKYYIEDLRIIDLGANHEAGGKKDEL